MLRKLLILILGTLCIAATYGTATFKGNVGIGTTSLAAPLSVMSGNVGVGTWLPRDALEVNGTIYSNKIGIGTTVPRTELEVYGTLGVSNSIIIGGDLQGQGSAAIGSVQYHTNQACNTTCIYSCLFGFDETARKLTTCADNTADDCYCLGPS
jgi:hypothetical protein